jgi:hypothetical protein
MISDKNCVYNLTWFSSVYNADAYIVDFINDFLNQTNSNNIKLLLINICNSHTNPSLVNNYIKMITNTHTNITCIEFETDPGLYECWNYAITKIDTKYITNANLDDRHHADYSMIFTKYLEDNPECSVAISPCYSNTLYQSKYTNNNENIWFQKNKNDEILIQDMYDETHKHPMNYPHSCPVWRRELHDKFGFFDYTNNGKIADYKYWMKLLNNGCKIKVVSECPLYLYYYNKDSYGNSDSNKFPKVSIIHVCKNINDNLLNSMNSYIYNDCVDEIVIVYFNNQNTREFIIKNMDETYLPKFHFIEITNNINYIASYVNNIGLYFCKNEIILKIDNATIIDSGKFFNHYLKYDFNSYFISNAWNNTISTCQSIRDIFFTTKTQISKYGYYNHNILFDGWEDVDMKTRLGTKKVHIVIHDMYIKNEPNNNTELNNRVFEDDTNIIRFFGFELNNINSIYPLIFYNKCLLEIENKITAENTVLKLFTVEETVTNHSKIKVITDTIKMYDTNLNYLSEKKTSICKKIVFEKMCKDTGNQLVPNNINGTLFKYFVEKYNINIIEDKLVLFYILFFNTQPTKNNTLLKNTLVTVLNNETNIAASLEMLYCLKRNYENEYISNIDLLFYENPNYNSFLFDVILKLYMNVGTNCNSTNKIKIIINSNKLYTYNNIFDYCNKHICGNTVISNPYTIYDETLKHLIYLNDDDFISLTRYQKYDYSFKLIHLPKYNNKINIFSQSSLMFKSPLKYNITSSIPTETSCFDIILNGILSTSNYKCYNLYKSIKSVYIRNIAVSDDFFENKLNNHLLGMKLNILDDFKHKVNYNNFVNKKNFINGIDINKHAFMNDVTQDILQTNTITYVKEEMNGYNIYYYDNEWQVPVITEYQTFQLFYKNKNLPNNYFAFPFATMIDNVLIKNNSKLYDLLNTNVSINETSCFTVCQHIRFRQFLYLFKKIGITHIFTPHKQNDDYLFEAKYNIKIYPYILFSVQNNVLPIYSFNNTYLLNFIGQYDNSCYLTNIREQIFNIFGSYSDCYIKRQYMWHYNDIVYKNKEVTENIINDEFYKNLLETSVFTLCPSGSGPNSIRIYEAMSYGSIPIILSDKLVLPDLNIDYNEFCIIWEESKINELYSFLKEMDKHKIESMRKKCIEVYKLYFSNEKLNYCINYYYNNIINKNKIISINQYYKETKQLDYNLSYSNKRQSELDYCLLQNSKNMVIDEIHLLVEEIYDLSFIPIEYRSKNIQVNINKRLEYNDVFEYYNAQLSNQICILQNTDIYTDNSLKILNNINFELNVILSLNRYEINQEITDEPNISAYLLNGLEYNNKIGKKTNYLTEFQPSIWTQDVWIWKCKQINIPESNFCLGITGCDNHIAYLFKKNGYTVLNPSHLICIFHYDTLSITYTEFGLSKGNVSNRRENRIKCHNEYLFLENIKDIPDKYTRNIQSNYLNKQIITSTFEKTYQEIVLSSNQIISAPDQYFIYDFNKLCNIIIIDITGNSVDRNNNKLMYVSKFKIEYFINEEWVLKSQIYNGITNNASNFIKRIYLDVPIICNKIKIIPIKFVNSCILTCKFFTI